MADDDCDPHDLECARAALAARIENAKTTEERKELKQWLAGILKSAKLKLPVR